MKKHIYILIICFALLSSNSFGQCIANAGKDTTLCVTFRIDTFRLGTTTTATNGKPPYTFNWSCNYNFLNTSTLTASDFLDDSTSANPRLLDHNSDTLAFYLSVTDSLGNICKDTIVIRFCGNYAWTPDSKFASINLGDTTTIIPSVANGCAPLSFQWFPNYNISDPNIENPSVWPDTSTQYYSIVTDAAGCQALAGTFDVFVNPLNSSELKKEQSLFNINPNPLIDNSSINTDLNDLKIFFYDVMGRMIHESNTQHSIEINRAEFKSAGIYFYTVFKDNTIISQGKLIVQ